MRNSMRNANNSDTTAAPWERRKNYQNERWFPELNQTVGLATGRAWASETPGAPGLRAAMPGLPPVSAATAWETRR